LAVIFVQARHGDLEDQTKLDWNTAHQTTPLEDDTRTFRAIIHPITQSVSGRLHSFYLDCGANTFQSFLEFFDLVFGPVLFQLFWQTFHELLGLLYSKKKSVTEVIQAIQKEV
jgi:hypothetical protein